MVSKGHSRHGFQIKISGPDRDFVVDLADGEVSLGRGSGSDVVVSHEEVSRRHLKLKVEGGKVFITDEGSRNGTFIDGSKIASGTEQEWRPGQALKLGMAPHQISLHVVELSQPESIPHEAIQPQPLQPVLTKDPKVGTSLNEASIDFDRELAELKLERQRLKSEIENLTRARADLEVDFRREFARVETEMESVRDRFMVQGREHVARFKKQGEMLVTEAEAKAKAIRDKAHADAAEQRRLLQIELGEMRLKQMAEFKAEMAQATGRTRDRKAANLDPDEFDISVVTTATELASESDDQSADDAPTMIRKIPDVPRDQDRRKPGGSARPYTGVERRGRPSKPTPPSPYRTYGMAVAGVALAVALGVVARFAAQLVAGQRPGVADQRAAFAKDFETQALAFLTGDLGMDQGASMAIVRAEVDLMSQSGRGIASEGTSQVHETLLQSLFRDPVKYERFIRFRSDFIQKRR